MKSSSEFSQNYGQPTFVTAADGLRSIHTRSAVGRLSMPEPADFETVEPVEFRREIDPLLIRGIGQAATGFADGTEDFFLRLFRDGQGRAPTPVQAPVLERSIPQSVGSYALAA
ncbi:MAG TPA: hypothetical protein VF575_00690 [Candidatus Saccharimonadales bacterium]